MVVAIAPAFFGGPHSDQRLQSRDAPLSTRIKSQAKVGIPMCRAPQQNLKRILHAHKRGKPTTQAVLLLLCSACIAGRKRDARRFASSLQLPLSGTSSVLVIAHNGVAQQVPGAEPEDTNVGEPAALRDAGGDAGKSTT